MEYKGDIEPAIHDFFLESITGEDLTNHVLTADNVLLVVASNLSKSDKEGFSSIKPLTDLALQNGYAVYILTSSVMEEYTVVKNDFELNFEMLFCDETTLKTIIRANPGVMTLQNGTVTGKWSWIDSNAIKL